MAQVMRIGSPSSDAAAMTHRRAVKALAVRDGLLLMLRSGASGDLKFPGGGVDGPETDQQALAREVGEECGAELSWMGDAILELVETRPDTLRDGADFRMVSVHYRCSIESPAWEQHLDDYEQDLRLSPEWVAAEAALRVNESILSTGNAAAWVEREALVLRWLIENGTALSGIAARP